MNQSRLTVEATGHHHVQDACKAKGRCGEYFSQDQDEIIFLRKAWCNGDCVWRSRQYLTPVCVLKPGLFGKPVLFFCTLPPREECQLWKPSCSQLPGLPTGQLTNMPDICHFFYTETTENFHFFHTETTENFHFFHTVLCF